MISRMQVEVRGIVQGVGFRPYVYSLARRHHLTGFCSNNTSGVHIEVEGIPEALQDFVRDLEVQPPTLARIETVECFPDLEPRGFSDFLIAESAAVEEKFVLLSPDVSTCADCERELFDPRNRRYLYPFINCTNCGPRFSI